MPKEGAKNRMVPTSKKRPKKRRKTVDPNAILPALRKLSIRTASELLRMWSNAVEKLASKEKKHFHEAARRVLASIEREWKRRGLNANDRDAYFKWPSTEAPVGGRALYQIDSPHVGVLAYLGYRVGRTSGCSQPVRLLILTRVFEGGLPPIDSMEYVGEWGANASATRLRKMAHTIASFVRLNKRKRDSRLEEAIAEWECDLRLLKEKYYIGKFGFQWPSISV